MPLTVPQARDVMLGVFKTAWDTTGFPAVYAWVPGQVPATETVWARVTIRHSTGRQSSLTGAIGTTRYTNRGLIWVQIFSPLGDGGLAGYAAAQTMLRAYRDANTSVLFRNVRLNEADYDEEDGAFQRFDVKIDFEFDDVS